MIGLASLTFDPSGHAYLYLGDVDPAATNVDDISRRSTRTATIDGGASLYDAGQTSADMTFTVAVKSDSAHIDTLRRLVQFYDLVSVTTRNGAYTANPSALRRTRSGWTLTLLVMGDA